MSGKDGRLGAGKSEGGAEMMRILVTKGEAEMTKALEIDGNEGKVGMRRILVQNK